MKKILIFIASCLSFVSCRYSGDVRTALRLAGDNREELEKVLEHYRQEDRHGLKYKAAEYLIGNMTFHQSYPAGPYMEYAREVDSLFLNEKDQRTLKQEICRVSDKYRDIMIPQNDIRIITADYLIWNIDYSFDLWKTGRFLGHLDFDEFCEYILPYKCVELQPIGKWKEEYSMKYRGDLDRLEPIEWLRFNARKAVEVTHGEFLEWASTYMIELDCIPFVDFRILEHSSVGTCRERSILEVLNGRSKGIPVSTDLTPMWGGQGAGHFWNVVHTGYKKNIHYESIFGVPGSAHYWDTPNTKVYRYSYRPDMKRLKAKRKDRYFPKELSYCFVKDVTDEYCGTTDLKLNIEKGRKCMSGYAYLCVSANDYWYPVDVTEVKRGKVGFKDVAKGILYMVVSYDEGSQVPLMDPFIVHSDGELEYVRLDREEHVDITLRRKFPAFQHILKRSARLGDFAVEGADSYRPDDFVQYGTSPTNTILSNTVSINDSIPRRYWRLRALENQVAELAEVYFYERGSGKLINRQARIVDEDRTGAWASDLIDRNPLSNYPLTHEKAVVFDFGRPVSLDRVSYAKRGDGNDICPGETYELYYWDNQWILHERKVAEDIYLEFEGLPADALYYIKCTTSGKQNRIFIYRNGEIRWY